MALELDGVFRIFVLIIGIAVGILWVGLPFAVYGIKKKMDESRELQERLLQELFWLRQTVETIPGAGGVARRYTQQLLNEYKLETGEAVVTARASKPAPAAESEPEPEPRPTPKKAAAKPAPKRAAKRKEPLVQKKEPRIDASQLAADDDFDEDDFEDEDIDIEGVMDLSGGSKAKQKAKGMSSRTVVDVADEDEIEEDEDGFFIYRGERYEHLIDAMRQQQEDSKGG